MQGLHRADGSGSRGPVLLGCSCLPGHLLLQGQSPAADVPSRPRRAMPPVPGELAYGRRESPGPRQASRLQPPRHGAGAGQAAPQPGRGTQHGPALQAASGTDRWVFQFPPRQGLPPAFPSQLAGTGPRASLHRGCVDTALLPARKEPLCSARTAGPCPGPGPGTSPHQLPPRAPARRGRNAPSLLICAPATPPRAAAPGVGCPCRGQPKEGSSKDSSGPPRPVPRGWRPAGPGQRLPRCTPRSTSAGAWAPQRASCALDQGCRLLHGGPTCPDTAGALPSP